jgi:sugar lactone lactonase YvrE
VSVTVEQITPSCTFRGESLIWDDRASSLRWVDLLKGDVLSLPMGGVVHRAHVGHIAAAIRPRSAGGLVVALERGFAIIDDDGAVRHGPELWSDATIRMNDGACDPQGRFYCGSMSYAEAPGLGVLYRLDPDGSASVVLRGLGISNGLSWLDAGDEALYVDSLTQRIDVLGFNADEGTFASRRPLVTIDQDDGMPDGIALDVDDGVWVALWGGGGVHRYTREGQLDSVVSFPVRNVTSCAIVEGFLYVTTSANDDLENPKAGALFRADVGVKGQAVRTFAG